VSSLVELARFPTRIAADLARLRLESEGIDAVLFDAETAGIGWGPMMPVRLMVLEEDRWLAAKLLEEDAG
jgi:acetate kinase